MRPSKVEVCDTKSSNLRSMRLVSRRVFSERERGWKGEKGTLDREICSGERNEIELDCRSCLPEL